MNCKRVLAFAFSMAPLAVSSAQVPATGRPVPITVDNFVRAETDMYFTLFVKRGALGKFVHLRELPLEGTGVRPNRETLYSQVVFDLDAGPATVTMPDPGNRYMSLMVVDQDHYVRGVFYGTGRHTFTREQIGTRYVFAAARTLVDPNNPGDMNAAHALQNAITVDQPGGPGRLEVPNWDPASQKKVREALLSLADTLPAMTKAFGTRDQVDPIRHLIGTASAWGGNPDTDAQYLNVTPAVNDGVATYRFSVKDVPVDAFWSVTVYDATGHFRKNALNAYSLNSITAKTSADGTVTVQFGGCDGKVPNCLPVMKGWNYMVRLYRPRAEILNGTWKFPEATRVK
jgi:hypothetical protein